MILENSLTIEENGVENKIISFPLLLIIRDLQQKHGLRHNDFQRYRGYCSRRLLRLRKVTHLVQDKKKFSKKEVTNLEENASGDKLKLLMIPLMTVERAWSYAMQLKFEVNTEPRKKFHMRSRFRKAKNEVEKLEKIVLSSEICDARSKLEVEAYAAWIIGTHYFENQQWRESMATFSDAKTIYEKLAVTLGEEDGAIYKQKIQDITPNLRYCAYNSGDSSAKQDLIHLRGRGQDLEDLINQTKEQQAANLREVEWRGRKMIIKHEKVRMFLLRYQELKEELDSAVSFDEKISVYESFMMSNKDALQVLKDDLSEDPSFRNRQQNTNGPITSTHFLYTYLCYIKCTKVIERFNLMIDSLKLALNQQEGSGKKPIKAQDLVRLYENIISNLSEIPLLSGLEDDVSLKQEMDAKISYYKSLRCYYIASSFLSVQKWSEAMAMYERSVTHANSAIIDSHLNETMKKESYNLLQLIESNRIVAHANSLLDNESIDSSKHSTSSVLLDRLDTYVDDVSYLLKGKEKLVNFPPDFTPMPCKALFFDLALEHLTFPSFDSKLKTESRSINESNKESGWLGGWLGGWRGQK